MTIETKDTIKISDKFQNYLAALKEQGQTHLYINLMNRLNTPSQSNPEKISEGALLLRVIEELETDRNVGEAIMVVSIDKNCDFYNQKNEFARKNQTLSNGADVFKFDFMRGTFFKLLLNLHSNGLKN